jgi:hypothetical protein
VLARIRDLNRLELAGRRCGRRWRPWSPRRRAGLAAVIDASWQQVYGQRAGNLRLPEAQAARDELAVQYGKDGYFLLEQVYGPGAPVTRVQSLGQHRARHAVRPP